MSPQFLTVLIAIVAVIGLSRASFAAAAGAAVAPPGDPVLANIESLRAEIVAKFDSGEASRKQTDARLAELERAVAASRLFGHDGAAPTGDKPPAGRLVSGLMRSAIMQRTGRDPWKGYEAERAALSSEKDADAGYLIPSTTDPFILQFLRPNLIMDQLGVRMINPKGNPHHLVEVSSGPSGGWVGTTNPTVNESTFATARKSLRPKMYGMLVKVDKNALLDADINLESEVRDLMNKKIAEDMDLAFFSGLGSEFQPRGVLNYTELQAGGAQVHSLGTNGGTATFKDVSKLIGMLEDANAMPAGARLGFVSHPKTRRLLKNERIAQYSGDASGGVYLPGSPIMSDAQFESAVGYPWKVTTQLPTTDVKGSLSTASPIVFANWADSVFGMWPGTEIIPLYELGAVANQVWFLVFKRADVLIQRIASFAAIRDADISAA